MAVYVNDIQIIELRPLVDWVKRNLYERFKITDLGPYIYYLGMRMERNRAQRTIKISQPGHVENVLKAHQMADANPQSTPMEANANTALLEATKEYQADPADVTAYKSGVGQLMYLMTKTRSDIAYAVCKLSTFNVNPTAIH